MPIYIHSRARAPSVYTLGALPKSLRRRVQLVVRQDEKHLYEQQNYGVKIVTLPKGVDGLSPTRQWILDNAEARVYAMLDDDLVSFNWKKNVAEWKLVRANDEQIERVFGTMLRWVQGGECACASFTDRASSARPSDKDYYENGRVSQVFVIDRDVARKHARFDRVPLFQDKDFVLQLLRAGFRTRVSTKLSFNASPVDAPGGCALYRTDKLRVQTIQALTRLHPDVVKMDYVQKFGRQYPIMRTRWRMAFKGEPR